MHLKKIKSFVLGGHGDTMVPMLELTTIDGKPLKELIQSGRFKKETLNNIIERTRKGGAEIVKYLEKGSAFYAPAASRVEMAESYLKNEGKILPCAAYLNGEYGEKDIYAGVPVKIGNKGIEKVVEVKLSENEKKEFSHSVQSVRELFEAAKKIDPSL